MSFTTAKVFDAYDFSLIKELESNFSLLHSLNKNDLADISNTVRQTIPETSVLRYSPTENTNISIKLENETPSGSFKIRGASYYMSRVSKYYGRQMPHIFAASTGNHGISLAKIANDLRCPLTLVVPNSTPAYKKEQILKHRATLICSGDYLDDSLKLAKSLASSSKGLFVDSVHHLLIMGHTSLGFELFKQLEFVDILFFPIGVGSGISATCIARNLLSPQTKLIGVVPEACKTWITSRLNKRPTFENPNPTVADGLRTALPDLNIFKHVEKNLFGLLSVSEAEILNAQGLYKTQFGIESEITGAVGLAGLLQFSSRNDTTSKHLATVLCGGKTRN